MSSEEISPFEDVKLIWGIFTNGQFSTDLQSKSHSNHVAPQKWQYHRINVKIMNNNNN